MFTRNRLPPINLQGEWKDDRPQLIRWITDYWLRLETKNALTINEAEITASQGIKFPATQVSFTDANTLDDYVEVPAWTPADGSGAGLVLTITEAEATKIGNRVFGHCYVTYPVTASGANALISGLPYSASGTHIGAMECTAAGGYTTAQITGTTIQPLKPVAAAVTNAQLSGAVVIVSFQFKV